VLAGDGVVDEFVGCAFEDDAAVTTGTFSESRFCRFALFLPED
jgi:hypothetical protein